jgi:ubiquinone biosynthesis protein UbiJ
MFPGPTMMAMVTQVIKQALNRTLRLDPIGSKALLEALDEPIAFQFEHINVTLTLHSAGGEIHVSSQPSDDAVLTVTGPPLSFAALAQGDDSLFSGGRLQVSGDVSRAHQLQRAMAQLDPDWEAALSHYTGEIPAHFIGQRVRGAVRWQRQAIQSLTASAEEYIHEETRALPGRREMAATFDDIDQLSLQTDRLAARIAQLENGLNPESNGHPTSPNQSGESS